MRRFKVLITSSDAIETAKALDAASIPHFGPSFAEFVSSEGSLVAGPDLTAIVWAEDVTAAERRVRDVCDAGCELGEAELFESESP